MQDSGSSIGYVHANALQGTRSQESDTVDNVRIEFALPEFQIWFWPVDAWRQRMSLLPSPLKSPKASTRQLWSGMLAND